LQLNKRNIYFGQDLNKRFSYFVLIIKEITPIVIKVSHNNFSQHGSEFFGGGKSTIHSTIHIQKEL
jgi:hypothetical protein